MLSDTAIKVRDRAASASSDLEAAIEHNPLAAVFFAMAAGLARGIAKRRAQMDHFINRLASEATTPIGDMSTRLFKMAVLYFLTMSCLFAGTIFLTIASLRGSPAFGGVHRCRAGGRRPLSCRRTHLYRCHSTQSLAMSQTDVTGLQATAGKEWKICMMPPGKAQMFADKIDETVAPLLGILREAGMSANVSPSKRARRSSKTESIGADRRGGACRHGPCPRRRPGSFSRRMNTDHESRVLMPVE